MPIEKGRSFIQTPLFISNHLTPLSLLHDISTIQTFPPFPSHRKCSLLSSRGLSVWTCLACRGDELLGGECILRGDYQGDL